MDKFSQIKIIALPGFVTKEECKSAYEEWQMFINIALEFPGENKKVHTFEFNDDYTIFIIVYHVDKK